MFDWKMFSTSLETIDRRTFKFSPPHAESIVQYKKISNMWSREYRGLVAIVMYYEIQRDSNA